MPLNVACIFVSERDEEFDSSLKELQERLDSVINTQTSEREEIDRKLEEKLQQIVELSGQLGARNAELEKENKEKEGIISQLKSCKGTISFSTMK